MSEYTGLDNILHFHRQNCSDPECNADELALTELAALRQRVAELEAAQYIVTPNNLKPDSEKANQADSLQAWAALWEHIAGRIGTGETPLPNAANFDAMLLPWAISE